MGYRFIDQYSLLHVASGIIAYFFGLSVTKWFMIHLIFELIENTDQGIVIINKYFTFWPGGKLYADSMINIISDQTFSIIGFYLANMVDYLGNVYGLYPKHINHQI